MNSDIAPVIEKVEAALTEGENSPPESWQAALEAVLAFFNCPTGTIHTYDAGGDKMLHLRAHRGIPEELMPKVTVIPIGKGIAGAAAERREAVELCNLQQDLGGVAREDARKTNVSGSIAIPLLKGDDLKGTLGIGKFEPYDFTEAEEKALWEIGAKMAGCL